jgi:AraC-like DNA-binding protein
VTTRTKATASTAGVLHPDEFARHVALERRPPGDGVARWVENHWSLRWDLPAGRWYPSRVLPHPTCSLTLELGDHPRPDLRPGDRLVVTGVCTRRFDVDLRGWGRVLGLRFRPGGLAALTGRPARRWTDRSVPATDVLPAELCAVLDDPDLAGRPDEWTAAAEDGLAALAGEPDPRYDHLLDVVADMLADRTLLTVAEVGERHGAGVRTLQRLFTHFVGVGPKAVLARYRMHDAVSELDEGWDGTLTDLAHRYGWYDQAHFTRDFTALVGVTPGRYRGGDR